MSAALHADAATSYRVMEQMAQDYSALARHRQFIVPMAYIKEQERPVDWISKVALAARYRVGNREVLAGLEAYPPRPPRADGRCALLETEHVRCPARAPRSTRSV